MARCYGPQRFAEAEHKSSVAVRVTDLPDRVTALSPDDNHKLLSCLRRELAFDLLMCYTQPEVGAPRERRHSGNMAGWTRRARSALTNPTRPGVCSRGVRATLLAAMVIIGASLCVSQFCARCRVLGRLAVRMRGDMFDAVRGWIAR